MTDLISKEAALWEWVSKPPEHEDQLLFHYLRGKEGSCAIAPVEDRVVKRYVNGTAFKNYVFALQINLIMSDGEDNTNIENMILVRTWQKFLKAQQIISDYPDFGPHCSQYRIRTGDDAPTLTILEDNNQARYDFFATIEYLEEPLENYWQPTAQTVQLLQDREEYFIQDQEELLVQTKDEE